LIKIYN